MPGPERTRMARSDKGLQRENSGGPAHMGPHDSVGLGGWPPSPRHCGWWLLGKWRFVVRQERLTASEEIFVFEFWGL